MDFKKCNRCGSFYLSDGHVCPNCNTKDTFELTTFKSYIERNGTENSLNTISQELGISTRNLNRFLSYDELKEYANDFISNKNTKSEKNNKNVNL